jgi:hypothetical protein
MRDVSDKSCRENQSTHFVLHIFFFFKFLAIYEIMWKSVVELDRLQMTIWHMCIASWVPKATNIHSEYVILIAFPLQQWLYASMLHYMYITHLVIYVKYSSMDKVLLYFVGVLLHGPPGCGKTMIAKATASEARTRFINLDVSMLTDKWYGESQKLAAAVFTLAVKLQPCIIFIDEIGKFMYLFMRRVS